MIASPRSIHRLGRTPFATDSQGKVANLEGACKQMTLSSTLGIAHTRWATHGAPSDTNAHPHTSSDGRVAVVHNGIIENFASLRTALISEGYTFVSETDTELFAHLVHDVRAKNPDLALDQVVRLALQPVSSGDATRGGDARRRLARPAPRRALTPNSPLLSLSPPSG